MKYDYFRGHPIKQRANGVYIYVDTGELVAETWEDRPCGYCGKHNSPEGYDGCIGEIEGAINACCGHGNEAEAYIQYPDGRRLGGRDAMRLVEERAICRLFFALQ